MSLRLVLYVCAGLLIVATAAANVPQMINYQGRLIDGGGQPVTTPVNVIFALWNADTDGDSLWSEPRTITPDGNGSFITLLGTVSPIPDSAFAGEAFLSIKVGADPEMSPRAQIVSVGYAYRVGSLEGAVGGGITGNFIVVSPADDSTIIGGDQIVIRGAGGDKNLVYCSSSGITVTDQNGDVRIKIAIDEDGPGITLYESPSGLARGPEDIGARKVEFREGGVLLFGTSDLDTVCHLLPDGNIVGKGQLSMGRNHTSSSNWANVLGYNNDASGDSSVVCGGVDNAALGLLSVVCGGTRNEASNSGAIVGGGLDNIASGNIAFVGGGFDNQSTGQTSVVGGGIFNEATATSAVVGGGDNNTASGTSATVPGGNANFATANYSFAAGRHARAEHSGTFVWNDGDVTDFASTNTDQFLISAANGVGVNTNSPQRDLHVAGDVQVDDSLYVDNVIQLGDGASDYGILEELSSDSDPWDSYISNGGIAIGSNTGADRQRFIFADGSTTNQIFVVATSENSGSSWQADFIIQQNGFVGIGTTGPSYPLDVNGDIGCETLHETSDARLKSDITPITGALETVNQLRGVTYTWNCDEYPERKFDDKAHLGFLAQEIQDIVPELVSPDADGFLAVDYSHMAPLLVEAIKELKTQNESKDARIDQLETKLAEVQALLEKILAK